MSARKRFPKIAAALWLCVAVGCGDNQTDDSPVNNSEGNNPLVPEVAALPFPSDFYLQPDPTTATGRRLVMPADATPGELRPDSLDAPTAPDGFSLAPLISTWFASGVDVSSLPDLATSITDDASVWLVREQTWERVPILVELDAQAPDLAEQSLIIRPQVVLEPGTGYVVIIRDRVRAADGSALPVSDGFSALRDGVATEVPEIEAQRADFELVNDAIAAMGIEPGTVVLAWSFHTRSHEQLRAPLLAMHDIAMTAPLDTWQITSDEMDDDNMNRRIEGTFVAPNFLDDNERIQVDASGAAIQQGTREVPFLLTIPVTAFDRTRPVIVFGHGLFSSQEETNYNNFQNGLQQWAMPAISTYFLGLNEHDLADTLLILNDTNESATLISQLMQSHIHFTLLGRLAVEQLAGVVTSPGGEPLLDTTNVTYFGISNGGSQGPPLVAASPFFTRAIFVVPGGAWMHMFNRALQWGMLGPLLIGDYPDPRELQVALSLIQLHFDYVDTMSWISALADRPAGRPDVTYTLHQAVGDVQVRNMISEWIARSGQVPLITQAPPRRPIWGIEVVESVPPTGAAVDAGFYVYDEGYPLLSHTNVTPEEENGAHESVRVLPSYKQHIGAFLEQGIIINVCDGACDPD